MALDKNRIKELLGTGLGNEIVATAVGCDPSYITQLLADEEFAGAVSELRATALTANSARDRKIDTIEDLLIDQMHEAVEMKQIYKPQDILRSFAVINAAKRRGVPAHQALVINNNIVNLQIPEAVVKNFTVNTHGEVVDVEGETLVTMPAHNLLKKLAESRGDKGAVYESVSRYLPASIVERDKTSR